MVEKLLSGAEVIEQVYLGLREAHAPTIVTFSQPVSVYSSDNPFPKKPYFALQYETAASFRFSKRSWIIAVGEAADSQQLDQRDLVTLYRQGDHPSRDRVVEAITIEHLFKEYAHLVARDPQRKQALSLAMSTGYLTFPSSFSHRAFQSLFPEDTFGGFSVDQPRTGTQEPTMRYRPSIVDHLITTIPAVLERGPGF